MLLSGVRARVRPILALLASPLFYICLGATLLLLCVAYQTREAYRIAVGGTPLLDQPYVFDAYPPEFTDADNIPFAFRWTQATTTIALPGLGTAPYELMLTLSPGPKPDPWVQINVNHVPLSAVRLESGVHVYQLTVPAALVPTGDLQLQVATELFVVPGDVRELGVALGQVAVRPMGDTWIGPARLQLVWLAGAVALVMLLCAYCGLPPRVASLVGGVWALGEAYLIAFQRLWITPFSETLLYVLLGAGLLLLVLDPLLRYLWRRLSWDAAAEPPLMIGSYAQLLVLAAGAFVIYLGGMLHPQIQMYDIGFHANRVADLWVEGNYFTKTGSAEWGSRETFYPLFPYMFMAPLRLFVRDTYLLIKTFMVLLDIARLVALYVLVRYSTGNPRAAGLAAFFLAVLPISIIPHQWGIVSNLFGETVILLSLTILVLGYQNLKRPLVFALLTAALTVALVSHPGALVLSGAVTGVVIVLLWLQRETRAQSWVVAGSFGLALLASFGLYHWRTVGEMLPAAQATLQNQLGEANSSPGLSSRQAAGVVCRQDQTASALKIQVGGSVIDPMLGLEPRCVHSWAEVMTGGVRGFVAETIAYFRLVPAFAVPFALAWLWRARADDQSGYLRQRLLLWCLVAWLATAALFALVGLTINLYVRYSLFAAPAIAIAMGIVLERLSRMSGWGKLVVWGTLLYFGVMGLGLWYTRITYAGH